MRGGGAGPEYQCRAAATSPLNITATGGDNALAGAGAGVECRGHGNVDTAPGWAQGEVPRGSS